jgi:hypothetical protein
VETGKESDIAEAFDMLMMDHEKVVRSRHAKVSKNRVKVVVNLTVYMKGILKRCNIIIDNKVE